MSNKELDLAIYAIQSDKHVFLTQSGNIPRLNSRASLMQFSFGNHAYSFDIKKGQVNILGEGTEQRVLAEAEVEALKTAMKKSSDMEEESGQIKYFDKNYKPTDNLLQASWTRMEIMGEYEFTSLNREIELKEKEAEIEIPSTPKEIEPEKKNSEMKKQKIDPVSYNKATSIHKQRRYLYEAIFPILAGVVLTSEKPGEKPIEEMSDHNDRYNNTTDDILDKILAGKENEITEEEFLKLRTEEKYAGIYEKQESRAQFLDDKEFFQKIKNARSESIKGLFGDLETSLIDVKTAINATGVDINGNKKNSLYEDKSPEEKKKIIRETQQEIINNVRKSNEELRSIHGDEYSNSVEQKLTELEAYYLKEEKKEAPSTSPQSLNKGKGFTWKNLMEEAKLLAKDLQGFIEGIVR